MGEQYDIVINIQGDEPLMEPHIIDDVVLALKHSPDAVYRWVAALVLACREGMHGRRRLMPYSGGPSHTMKAYQRLARLYKVVVPDCADGFRVCLLHLGWPGDTLCHGQL